MPFDQIMAAVRDGAGGRRRHHPREPVHVPAPRPHPVVDLGEWWERDDGPRHPARRHRHAARPGHDLIRRTERALGQSVDYAHAHPEHVWPTIRRHAQEMEDEVMRQHIALVRERLHARLRERKGRPPSGICWRVRRNSKLSPRRASRSSCDAIIRANADTPQFISVPAAAGAATLSTSRSCPGVHAAQYDLVIKGGASSIPRASSTRSPTWRSPAADRRGRGQHRGRRRRDDRCARQARRAGSDRHPHSCRRAARRARRCASRTA